MKTKSLYICALALLCWGCPEPIEIILEPDRVNMWIYQALQPRYLWSDEMKPLQSEDLLLDPESFFETVIRYRTTPDPIFPNSDGDRFSYMKAIDPANRSNTEFIAGHEDGFGFEARLFLLSSQVQGGQVIYTVRGSPAGEAGLQRGEEFSALMADGTSYPFPIERSLYTSLLENSREVTLCIDYPVVREVSLERAPYYDSPLLLDTVYQTLPPTAYLVYNHFTAGANNRYISELEQVFRRFRDAGATQLILDLRYNTGGELAIVRRLASLMARSEWLGEVLFYKENRQSYGRPEQFEAEYFLPASTMDEINMNAAKICMITSGNTASASELMIHALKPWYDTDLTQVGETTVGKNVASMTITNKHYLWELHPVTLRLHNRDRISGYEAGIPPDGGEVSELLTNGRIAGDFGDTGDPLLFSALQHITEGAFSAAGLSGVRKSRVAPVGYALPAGRSTEITVPVRGLSEGMIVLD